LDGVLGKLRNALHMILRLGLMKIGHTPMDRIIRLVARTSMSSLHEGVSNCLDLEEYILVHKVVESVTIVSVSTWQFKPISTRPYLVYSRSSISITFSAGNELLMSVNPTMSTDKG
jgi:hypothetical protein